LPQYSGKKKALQLHFVTEIRIYVTKILRKKMNRRADNIDYDR